MWVLYYLRNPVRMLYRYGHTGQLRARKLSDLLVRYTRAKLGKIDENDLSDLKNSQTDPIRKKIRPSNPFFCRAICHGVALHGVAP